MTSEPKDEWKSDSWPPKFAIIVWFPFVIKSYFSERWKLRKILILRSIILMDPRYKGGWSNCDLLFKRVINQLELSHVILLLHSWSFWKVKIEQHLWFKDIFYWFVLATGDTSAPLLIKIGSRKIPICRELFGGDLGLQETSLGAVPPLRWWWYWFFR